MPGVRAVRAYRKMARVSDVRHVLVLPDRDAAEEVARRSGSGSGSSARSRSSRPGRAGRRGRCRGRAVARRCCTTRGRRPGPEGAGRVRGGVGRAGARSRSQPGQSGRARPAGGGAAAGVVGGSWDAFGDGQEDRTMTTLSPLLTLAVGQEDLLLDRAVQEVVAAARAADADTDVRDLTPDQLQPGTLAELTSPSLFAERKVVVVRNAQDLSADTIKDVKAYLGAPAEEITLVLLHAGGAKGKGLLDAARKAGAREVACPEDDQAGGPAGVRAERVPGAGPVGHARRPARRWWTPSGAICGSWRRAVSQLVADVEGTIDEAVVGRYYTGRAEASSFTVADRAVEGRAAEALEALRWSLSTGVAPVLITSALAQGCGRSASCPRRGAAGRPTWPVSSGCRRGRSTGCGSRCGAGRRTGSPRRCGPSRRRTPGSRAAGTTPSTPWRRRSWPSPGRPAPARRGSARGGAAGTAARLAAGPAGLPWRGRAPAARARHLASGVAARTRAPATGVAAVRGRRLSRTRRSGRRSPVPSGPRHSTGEHSRRPRSFARGREAAGPSVQAGGFTPAWRTQIACVIRGAGRERERGPAGSAAGESGSSPESSAGSALEGGDLGSKRRLLVGGLVLVDDALARRPCRAARGERAGARWPSRRHRRQRPRGTCGSRSSATT